MKRFQVDDVRVTLEHSGTEEIVRVAAGRDSDVDRQIWLTPPEARDLFLALGALLDHRIERPR